MSDPIRPTHPAAGADGVLAGCDDLIVDGVAAASACVNIALIKYWGKAPAKGPDDLNLPAVPSLSLTLAGLGTTTRARFAPEAEADTAVLDGVPLTGAGLDRVKIVLDAVRRRADVSAPFAITSTNSVPTAAGLASSASGMAALAAAASRAAGLPLSDAGLSELARIGSGSASRSVFGGWVAWEGRAAHQVAPADHWPLRVIVAVIAAGPKDISSRAAMNRTARTSPYYHPWVTSAPALFDRGLKAVAARDATALFAAMEESTLQMHACAMTAVPSIRYLKPASWAVIDLAARLRAEGLTLGVTMDAGPNVKVFCLADEAAKVRQALTSLPGVAHTIETEPGAGVRVWVERSNEDPRDEKGM